MNDELGWIRWMSTGQRFSRWHKVAYRHRISDPFVLFPDRFFMMCGINIAERGGDYSQRTMVEPDERCRACLNQMARVAA